MKVRILRNLGTGMPPFKEGEEHDVDDALAEKWIAEGLAEVPPVKDAKGEKEMTAAQAKEAEEALKHHEGVAKTERAKAKAAADAEAKAIAEKGKA